MRVKCINIYNESKKQFETTHHRLTVGKEYVVLEIGIFQNNKIYYRLIGDNVNDSPAMHNASQFQIVSGRIPANWEIGQLNNVSLIIGPRAWQDDGFWEHCYDLNQPALEIYKREARIIFEEENK